MFALGRLCVVIWVTDLVQSEFTKLAVYDCTTLLSKGVLKNPFYNVFRMCMVSQR